MRRVGRLLNKILTVALISACQGPSPAEPLPELPPPVAQEAATRGVEKDPRQALIIFTAELRGEVDPCGCPTLPYGGFGRRQAVVEELSGLPLATFQVDGGDLLQPGVASSDPDPARVALIGDLMAELGVQAWVPAPSDLLATGGIEGVRAFPIQAVSATWTGAEGEPLLPAYRVLEDEGLRLAVIGVSARAEGLGYTPAAEAVKAAMATLPPVDLVVVVSNAGDAEAEALAELPGVGLVLSGRGTELDAPRQGAGAAVVESPDRGRYLSLNWLWLGSDAAQPARLDPEQERTLADLADVQARLLRVQTPELLAGREALEKTLALEAAGRNLVRTEERGLGSDLDADNDAARAVARWRASNLDAAASAAARPPEATGPRWASGASCARCHSTQMAHWVYTPHKKATQTLIEQRRVQEPACLECHTTAFGEPGGLGKPDAASLATWSGVQCEMCHGPLGGHPKDARVKPAAIQPSTCTGCHDAANDPDFDYATALPRIKCPTSP